ncbi:MAG: ester cyclase [Methanobacteriota archaeon]|nr:MAG: ester cyclase [Euryarchaeota archaeon]
MHSQASTQIAQALFDAFNAHDLDRLEALTSDGFLGIGPDSHDLRMGRRGGGAWAAAYFAGVPGSKGTKERILGQDAAFVLQVIYTGTHTGAFDGAEAVPPTHRTVSVPATFIGIARDGKIEDLRGYWDRLLVLRQLGLVPDGS